MYNAENWSTSHFQPPESIGDQFRVVLESPANLWIFNFEKIAGW